MNGDTDSRIAHANNEITLRRCSWAKPVFDMGSDVAGVGAETIWRRGTCQWLTEINKEGMHYAVGARGAVTGPAFRCEVATADCKVA